MTLAHNRVHRGEREEEEEESAVSVMALTCCQCRHRLNLLSTESRFIDKADSKYWLFIGKTTSSYVNATHLKSLCPSHVTLCDRLCPVTHTDELRSDRFNNLLTFLSSTDLWSSSIKPSGPELHRVIAWPSSSPRSVGLEALK